MNRRFLLFTYVLSVIALGPSCNHNKIACPTYADSFPESKKKKSTDPPSLPKVTKPRLSISPGGN